MVHDEIVYMSPITGSILQPPGVAVPAWLELVYFYLCVRYTACKTGYLCDWVYVFAFSNHHAVRCGASAVT